MKHWQSLTISVLAHAVLLSIPLTAALQMHNRSEAVRFVVVAGKAAAGEQSVTKALSGPARGAVHKETVGRSKPAPASAAKASPGPPKVRSAAPQARSGLAKARPAPPEVQPAAPKVQPVAPEMRPLSPRARPVPRPKAKARPEHRTGVHHAGKPQRRSARVAVHRKVPAGKVSAPRVRLKARAPAAPRHSNQKPAGRSVPAATAAVVQAQPAAADGSPAGAMARATASTVSTHRGPIKAQWGAANGPHFLHRVMPRYPRLARRLGKQGTVLLQVTIDRRGRPIQVKIVRGTGFGFDEQARRAVRNSLFTPARRAGRAVSCKVLLPVRFVLRSSP